MSAHAALFRRAQSWKALTVVARVQLTSAMEAASCGAAADGSGAAAGNGQEAQSPRAPQRPVAHAPSQATGAAALQLSSQRAGMPAAPDVMDEDRGTGSGELQAGPSAAEPAAGQLPANQRAPAAADAQRVAELGLAAASGGAGEPAGAFACGARAAGAERGHLAERSLAAAGRDAAEPAGGSAGVHGDVGAAGRGEEGLETPGIGDGGIPAVAGTKRGLEGGAQESTAGDLRGAERGAERGGEADAAKRARLGDGS